MPKVENNGEAGLPQETGTVTEERSLENEEETTAPEGTEDDTEDTDEEEETAPESTEETAPATPSDDPIDKWDEDKLDAVLFARDASLINRNLTVEQKRAELKKFRAIDSRNKGKGEGKSPDAPMTVGDFEKVNQKNAIREATTPRAEDSPEIAAIKKEIDENWDGVRTFYANRRGKATVADIVEDILDAHAAWKRKNGSSEGTDGTATAAELARTGRPRSGSGPVKPAPPSKATQDPRFSKPGGPEKWYPKKES